MENTPILNTFDVLHYYSIVALDSNRNIIEKLYWSDLKWELRLKYNWYFIYRAALLQVKFPKHTIQSVWGHYPATGKSLEELRKIQITNKKRQITKYKNLIELAKINWQSIFPIEDDIYYQKSIAKIEALEIQLKDIENTI